MINKNHLATTFALATGICNTNIRADQTFNAVLFTTGCLCTCLIPDLDSQNSLISKLCPIKFYKHTIHHGLWHSLLGFLLFTICTLIAFSGRLNFYLVFGLICGYLFHLFEDSFSQAGIIWLYPLQQPDQYVLTKYQTIVRPVHHYRKKYNKNIPIRHLLFRGYQVGGKFENYWGKLCLFLGLFFCFHFYIYAFVM